MANIEDVDIDVEDWIDGATFTQVRVTIHRNQALYAEYAPLLARIEDAEAEVDTLERRAKPDERPDGDGALGDAPTVTRELSEARAELDALYAAAEELSTRYEADREVWSLRALDQQEVQAIVAAHDIPKPPDRPKSDATPAVRKRYAATLAKTLERQRVVQTRINAEMIAAATLSVDVNGTVRPAPSVEGVERVAARPHGARHIEELITALSQITAQAVTIPAPHRRGA